MDEKLFVDACKSLAESYCFLYENTGFIDIESVTERVQVDGIALYDLSRKFRRKVNVKNRESDSKYSFEYSIEIKGLKFFAIGKHEKLIDEVKQG